MSRMILITGASSSFGNELITRLPKDVTIVAQSRDPVSVALKNTKQQINIVSDFSKDDFLSDFESKVDFVEIDDLVHFVANPMRMQTFVSTTTEQFLSDYKVNFLSLARLLVKLADSRKIKERQIRVVVVLTDMIRAPKRGETSYLTSKLALLGLVKSLAQEYSANELRINAVSPSLVETRFVRHLPQFLRHSISSNHPMKRHCTVAEVVDSVEFLLSAELSFINGQDIFVKGGEN